MYPCYTQLLLLTSTSSGLPPPAVPSLLQLQLQFQGFAPTEAEELCQFLLPEPR